MTQATRAETDETAAPEPQTAAGRIVSAYLAGLPHGADEHSRSIQAAEAAEMSRGAHAGGDSGVLLHLAKTATPFLGSASPESLRAAVIALSCWGIETRRSGVNSNHPFETIAVALHTMRGIRGSGDAAVRSLRVLARVTGKQLRGEFVRAAQLIGGTPYRYNHALLADDAEAILTGDGAAEARLRIAQEGSTGKRQRRQR